MIYCVEQEPVSNGMNQLVTLRARDGSYIRFLVPPRWQRMGGDLELAIAWILSEH